MASRIIAIVILTMFLGFVAVLLSIGVFIRDPLPIVGANGAAMLSEPPHEPVAARIDLDGGLRGRVQLGGVLGDAAPEVALYPVETGMTGAIGLEVGRDGGAVIAEGQLTTPGRWQLDVETGMQTHSFQFIVRP